MIQRRPEGGCAGACLVLDKLLAVWMEIRRSEPANDEKRVSANDEKREPANDEKRVSANDGKQLRVLYNTEG